jgi:hypothetical protein
MDISIFLAKFWGWYMITFFILLLLYPKRIKELFEFSKDDKFVVLISLMGIILGLLNIIIHNIWVWDWRLVITLFGWIVFIKSVTNFAFPEISRKWIEKIDFKWFHFLFFLLFLMGIFLLNQVYGIVSF